MLESLLSEARGAHPNECCGLVTGQSGVIQAVVPAGNVSANPATSFEIDPAVLLRAHREARGDGAAVIGHYHSHPNGNAAPSPRDAARATENGQLWLIVANGGVTAWEFRAGGFVQVGLVIA